MMIPTQPRSTSILLVVATLFLTANASAQNETEPDAATREAGDARAPGDVVEPTQKQKELNDKGVEALIDKEYARAVALLEESSALGELNLTYLNLGRAYQKLGQCEEARDAYLKAVSAPAVDEPPQKIIDAKANQYLGELEDECQFADSGMAEQSSVLEWSLIGGGAALVGFGAFAFIQRGQSLPVLEDATRQGDTVTSPSQRVAFERRDKANRWTAIGVSATALGLTAAGVGTFMMVTQESPESRPTAAVAPDGSVQLGWSVRF